MGVWATGTLTSPNNPDPKEAVWDEYVGMWATCLLLPKTLPWMAAAFVRRRTAPFEAWYSALAKSDPTSPSCDEMFTIEPPPALRISGIATLVPRKTPFALTFITSSHCCTGVSAIGFQSPLMPALFTRTSRRPNLSTAA